MDGSPASTERISLCSEPSMGGGTGKSPERLHRNHRNGYVICSSSINSAAGSPFGITIGEGTYLYSTVDGGKHWTPDPDLLFQGKDKTANVVRFTSRERGFVFFLEGKGQSRLAYTTDGGSHWSKQALAPIRLCLPSLRRRSLVQFCAWIPTLDSTSKVTARAIDGSGWEMPSRCANRAGRT